MKAKTRLTSRPVAELWRAGEAELGLQQIVAILPVKGAELVGPLPAELQNIIIYAAGISARAAEPKAAAVRLDQPLARHRRWRGSCAARVSSRPEGGDADTADVLAPSHFCAHIVLTSKQLRRYIPPTLRQAVSFARRNGLPGPR